MLEKPDIQEGRIIACLREVYGLKVAQIVFLPLGADQNTAVYRVVADDDRSYFLKLRGGVFDETSVTLPKFLSDQGIGHIVPPLELRTGQLWANLDSFKLILYPFVEGRNGYEVVLSAGQWADFGTALKSIHSAKVPPALIGRIRQETYSPLWRDTVASYLLHIDDYVSDEPVAARLAAFLQTKREEIFALIKRADRLAQTLQAQELDFVLCHSDLHAGNILVGANGAFYIVDWDEPVLAPKERDLMYIGGGLMGGGRTPQEEEALFYRGYGRTQIDPVALAYYRTERIVQDIAAYCEQLFLTDDGGRDRQQSLHYLMSNFQPGSTIEIAHRTDPSLKEQ